MKKLFIITAFCLTAGFSFAGDDQSALLKKMINRKILFPEQLKITETVTVEIQIEIMPDGCLAVTGSKGSNEVVNYIAGKINNICMPYKEEGQNVFVYRFTFEKEK